MRCLLQRQADCGLDCQAAQVAEVVAFFVEGFLHALKLASGLIDGRAKRSRFDIDDDRKFPCFGEGDDVCFHC